MRVGAVFYLSDSLGYCPYTNQCDVFDGELGELPDCGNGRGSYPSPAGLWAPAWAATIQAHHGHGHVDDTTPHDHATMDDLDYTATSLWGYGAGRWGVLGHTGSMARNARRTWYRVQS